MNFLKFAYMCMFITQFAKTCTLIIFVSRHDKAEILLNIAKVSDKHQ